MSEALEKKSPQSEALAITPAGLIQMALSKGADIEQLKQLMDLQERWEKNEARKAFVMAMNDFKADPPTITKNKSVSFGSGDRATSYNHATLDHVCDAVTKGLSKHGISHRWKVEQAESVIRVTCILTHDMGHSEETTLSGQADTSGSKNSIQAIGSTVTYLQRYTLLAATGLAASNGDTDGILNGNSPSGMDSGLIKEHCEWIANAKTLSELERMYKNACQLALEAADKNAIAAFKHAKEERKNEL